MPDMGIWGLFRRRQLIEEMPDRASELQKIVAESLDYIIDVFYPVASVFIWEHYFKPKEDEPSNLGLVAEKKQKLVTILTEVESRLDWRKFLCGNDFTIADPVGS